MAKPKIRISPPTHDEVETVRRELHENFEHAENQPISEKRSAAIVFAEKREVLEELLDARV